LSSSPASGTVIDSPGPAQLDLLIIVYRPGPAELQDLVSCLAAQPPTIRYSLALNAVQPQPLEGLEPLLAGALLVHRNTENLGYGRAANRLFKALPHPAPWVAALNTDLYWKPGSFETLLGWLASQHDVVAAVPQILNPSGQVERLTKRDPSLLALCSRRFLPRRIKPQWLLRLDARFTMDDHDLQSIFEVPYLSGCCLLVRSECYAALGGFDPAYFLYLEDADLTRRLRSLGRCLHLPVASVTHGWGRGSHRSLRLTLVNLWSAVIYFRRWGFSLWS